MSTGSTLTMPGADVASQILLAMRNMGVAPIPVTTIFSTRRSSAQTLRFRKNCFDLAVRQLRKSWTNLVLAFSTKATAGLSRTSTRGFI